MADKVKVRITDQAGGKNVNASLPADAPMSQLVPALITKLQLPSNTGYYISHKESGKRLGNNDTLSSAGVKDDDTLRLMPDVTAGKL